MGILVDFLRWLRDGLVRSVKWLLTVPGMVTACLAELVAFISSAFSRFEWTTEIVGYINRATTYVDALISVDLGVIGRFALRWFALDNLAASLVSLFALTVGLVMLVFSTFLVLLIAQVAVILGIRAIMKLISVCSGGFVKP